MALIDALIVFLLILAWLASLGMAYFQGKVDKGRWCREMITQSHEAQRQEMADLRKKLAAIGCITDRDKEA